MKTIYFYPDLVLTSIHWVNAFIPNPNFNKYLIYTIPLGLNPH